MAFTSSLTCSVMWAQYHLRRKSLHISESCGKVDKVSKIPEPIKNSGIKLSTERDTRTKSQKRDFPAKTNYMEILKIIIINRHRCKRIYYRYHLRDGTGQDFLHPTRRVNFKNLRRLTAWSTGF